MSNSKRRLVFDAGHIVWKDDNGSLWEVSKEELSEINLLLSKTTQSESVRGLVEAAGLATRWFDINATNAFPPPHPDVRADMERMRDHLLEYLPPFNQESKDDE